MPYILFDNKATRIEDPTITVSTGRIAFNAAAGDVLTRLGVKFVHILWDEQSCKLALRATKRDDKSHKVSFPKAKRGAAISAQSFTRHIEWTGTTPQIVPAVWNDKEKMFEASLPKEFVGQKEKRRKFRAL